MTDILEQLRDQSLQLARRSFDSVDAGLAANVADAAIDEIERLRKALEQIAYHRPTMSDFPHDVQGMQMLAFSALAVSPAERGNES